MCNNYLLFFLMTGNKSMLLIIQKNLYIMDDLKFCKQIHIQM